MLTGELRSQIDSIWNDFWSGGLANPLQVIEQITYLIFIKRLDEMQETEERKATMTGKPVGRRIFPEGFDGIVGSDKGADKRGEPYENLRWSRFRHDAPKTMFRIVDEHVFPFLRTLNGEGSAYARHMRDARFQIPSPQLLAKVIDKLDKLDMRDRDTKGDVYEYMLGKIASAGQNGQFRTPRHIIQLMVELTRPGPEDVICDPAAGTCGFLVAAGEFLREHHKELFRDPKQNRHFHHGLFNGFDFDPTMLRIGAMNMALHGVEGASVIYRDSLAEDHTGDAGRYSLVLANPPFAGSLDYDATAKDLQRAVKTKKTELLFIALILRLMKVGGRAAVIVPSGVLESDGSAHSAIRKALVEDVRLEAVISLPHWIFKPYASVSTAILLFQKGGATENIWFYKLANDGFADDASKTPIGGSDIPSLIDIWENKNFKSIDNAKKSRIVSRSEVTDNDYDLSPSFYLSGYTYPSGIQKHRIDEFFVVDKGSIPAASANDGEYPFVTSSVELRRYTSWTEDCEAICIPTVSATGHGHASIKSIHYVNGKFAASTITAVLRKRKGVNIYAPYVFYFLKAHINELLVPLMRGAANVSLSLDRLARLHIPVPRDLNDQIRAVRTIEKASARRDALAIELRKASDELALSIADLKRSF